LIAQSEFVSRFELVTGFLRDSFQALQSDCFQLAAATQSLTKNFVSNSVRKLIVFLHYWTKTVLLLNAITSS